MRTIVLFIFLLLILIFADSCEKDPSKNPNNAVKIDTLLNNQYSCDFSFVKLDISQFGSKKMTNSLKVNIRLDSLVSVLKDLERINGKQHSFNWDDSDITISIWLYYHSGDDIILSEFVSRFRPGTSITNSDKACVGDNPEAVKFFTKGLTDMYSNSSNGIYEISQNDNYWVSSAGSCFDERIRSSKNFFLKKVNLETNLKLKISIYKGNDIKLINLIKNLKIGDINCNNF